MISKRGLLYAAFMARPLSVLTDPDDPSILLTDPDDPSILLLDPDEEV